MKNLILVIFVFLTLVGCTRTENGLVFGIPDYEKRNIKVSKTDIDILLRAKELLITKNDWLKDELRTCNGNPPFSLYCALEAASIQIDGKYIHRRPALQEVRFIIDDNFKSRWKDHRLADFNSHPDTTFEDVKMVLDLAINHVKSKLAHNTALHPTS